MGRPSIVVAALFAFAGAALAQEGQQEDRVPPRAALERALAESVEASCPRLRYRIDESLTRAAEAFVRAVEAGRTRPTNTALWFFASLETADPVPVAGVATIAPAAHADRAVGDLYSRKCLFNRAGVAAARHGEGAIVALLTSNREGELFSIPGSLQPGAQITVSGKLPARMKTPRIFHLRPNGLLEERNLRTQPATPPLPEDRYQAVVAFPERGEHIVELVGEDVQGPRVLAMRRVFVGVDRPHGPPPEVEMAAAATDLDAVAAAISSLRAARGLPALVRDDALDAVARGHSEEMARTRTFAHVLPTDGSVSDRLFKAKYAHRFAGENIGMADTAGLAHEAVALSPGHLANLLHPRYKRLGLGAVKGTSPEGHPTVYLTEVFADPATGMADPSAEVLRVLQRQRQRRGLRVLQRDRRLDQVAERDVRAAARGGGARAAGETAQHALDAGSFRRAESILYVGAPESIGLEAKTLEEPAWTHVGVGAVYARPPSSGPDQLWVLVVFAR